MHIVDRVVAERRQLGWVEQIEGLNECRPLAPRTARIDLPVREAGAQGRLDRYVEVIHVLESQPSVVLAMERGDRGGDVAAVKRIAGGRQAYRPTGCQMRPLFLDHESKCGREVGLEEQLADAGRPAAWNIDSGARRPARVIRFVERDHIGEQRVHREAVARKADRRCRDVSERHRAEPFQRCYPSVWSRRHNSSPQPIRDASAVLAAEILGIGRLRPPTETAYRRDLFRGRLIEHDRGDARRRHDVRLQDFQGDTASHAGVDRVAASLQHNERRVRRGVMACHGHVARTHQRRPMRFRGPQGIRIRREGITHR